MAFSTDFSLKERLKAISVLTISSIGIPWTDRDREQDPPRVQNDLRLHWKASKVSEGYIIRFCPVFRFQQESKSSPTI